MTPYPVLPRPAVRWPRWADSLLALLILGYTLLVLGVPAGMTEVVPVLIAVGLCLPYPWRQRRPLLVFGLIAAVATVQVLVGVEPLVADVMIVLGLFGVARRHTWRWSVPAAALSVVWVIGALASRLGDYYLTIGDLGLLLAVIAVAWLAGTLARTREQYVNELLLRAERAEREQQARADAAATAERIRIARDLHDLVSHSLSAISVLAAGAVQVAQNDPPQARRAMQDVVDSSRSALQEMRSMLGVLRSEGPQSEAPQPGIDQLPELINESSSTGLPVRLHLDGELQTLPGSVQVACYRVVQESLTNIRRHAGADVSRVDVRLSRTAGAVVIMITDDGVGDADAVPGGHGLIGMRERVTALGGELSTGSRKTGGFEVRAVIPDAAEVATP